MDKKKQEKLTMMSVEIKRDNTEIESCSMDNDEFKYMNYFPIGKPFIVALKFTQENEETARKLWGSLINYKGQEEVLPNLKVVEIWHKDIGSGDVVAQRVAEKLGEITSHIQDYVQEQYNELYKELTNDGKFEKEHPNIPPSMVNMEEKRKEHKH